MRTPAEFANDVKYSWNPRPLLPNIQLEQFAPRLSALKTFLLGQAKYRYLRLLTVVREFQLSSNWHRRRWSGYGVALSELLMHEA